MHIDKNTTASLFRKIVEEESRAAYNEFFGIYYPKFIKIAIFYVKQHHFAEDVVSEVLIKIFKNRKKIMNVDNIEGYLFITVKNECLRYLEKNKRHIAIESIESEDDYIIKVTRNPENELISNEFFQVIKETVSNLPPKRRMIYRLIKEDGLKYKDVAELLNISHKTVDAHMGLAFKNLSKAILAYNEGNFIFGTIRKLHS